MFSKGITRPHPITRPQPVRQPDDVVPGTLDHPTAQHRQHLRQCALLVHQECNICPCDRVAVRSSVYYLCTVCAILASTIVLLYHISYNPFTAVTDASMGDGRMCPHGT